MNRKLIKTWFGSWLLGLSVAAGCSQTRQETGMSSLTKASPGMTSPGTMAANQARSPYATVPGVTNSVAAPVPAQVAAQQPVTGPVTQVVYAEPQTTPTAPAPMPAGETVTPAVYTEGQQQAPAPLPIAETQVADPATEIEPKTTSPRGEAAPQRRSFVDATAAPCFGHAPDYSQLSGQVEYSRLSKGWRLRFASVDEVDRYGGSVTLVENGDLDHLKDGQYVVVQGHLSNPDESGSSPAYRVDSFRTIDKPNSTEASANPK